MGTVGTVGGSSRCPRGGVYPLAPRCPICPVCPQSRFCNFGTVCNKGVMGSAPDCINIAIFVSFCYVFVVGQQDVVTLSCNGFVKVVCFCARLVTLCCVILSIRCGWDSTFCYGFDVCLCVLCGCLWCYVFVVFCVVLCVRWGWDSWDSNGTLLCLVTFGTSVL